MAISKVLHMKQAKSGYLSKHLANGLRYIMDPEKTEQGRFISGSNCIPEHALQQMLDTKRHFGKLDKRQGYHIIISFEEEELSEETAFEIVGKFVQEYLGSDYEAVYAIHNDTDHIHGHIIFNSVQCTSGYKYNYRKGEWDHRIQPLVNQLCKEQGLSILDMEKVQENRKRHKSDTLEAERSAEKRMSQRDKRVKRDVDQAIKDAADYQEFLEILQSTGYELHGKKHLAVQEAGASRRRRIDQLGDDYTEAMLRFRIEQPFISDQKRDNQDVMFSYLYIPYKNRHLTRYQKARFIQRYRAGKIHPTSKPWKYKMHLQALKRLQDEYAFWGKYQIHSKEQLKEIQLLLDSRLQKLRTEKSDLQEKKNAYQPILDLLDEMDAIEVEAELFQDGYKEFKKEYTEYQSAKERLSQLGCSLNHAKAVLAHFQTGFEQIAVQRKMILKEKRIANTLIKKVHDREHGMAKPQKYERIQEEMKQNKYFGKGSR